MGPMGPWGYGLLQSTFSLFKGFRGSSFHRALSLLLGLGTLVNPKTIMFIGFKQELFHGV